MFSLCGNSQKRNNAIEMVHTNESILLDHFEINDHIVHYYERLLTEQFAWRPKPDGLTFTSTHLTSENWIERPFEEDEVC